MSETTRQRAIEDVARYVDLPVESVTFMIALTFMIAQEGTDNELWRSYQYAVTQRERVLILEAENAELKAKLEGQWNARS